MSYVSTVPNGMSFRQNHSAFSARYKSRILRVSAIPGEFAARSMRFRPGDESAVYLGRETGLLVTPFLTSGWSGPWFKSFLHFFRVSNEAWLGSAWDYWLPLGIFWHNGCTVSCWPALPQIHILPSGCRGEKRSFSADLDRFRAEQPEEPKIDRSSGRNALVGWLGCTYTVLCPDILQMEYPSGHFQNSSWEKPDCKWVQASLSFACYGFSHTKDHTALSETGDRLMPMLT